MSSEQQERQDLHDPVLSKAPDNSAGTWSGTGGDGLEPCGIRLGDCGRMN